jgi:hypothetical protein
MLASIAPFLVHEFANRPGQVTTSSRSRSVRPAKPRPQSRVRWRLRSIRSTSAGH